MRILFYLFIFSHSIVAQEINLINKTALQVDEFIGFDAYKHLYYIKDGALYKEGDLGNFVFQDFQLGPIASVDIINPLNVVVFYAEMNSVVFLDNRLNEKERINFNDLPTFINVTALTNAGNNKLWIFNTDTQQLELYHYRNQQQTQVSQPFSGKFTKQISNFSECFVLTEKFLRKFNIYGSLLFEKKLDNFTNIVQLEENLIGVKENKLFLIDNNTIHPLTFNFNENSIKDLQLTQDFVYLYDSKILYTFTLTQPKQ